MAVQAIWSGTISFSLVAIPVRLVKAVEPGRISFRLLHGADHSPLQRSMYCPEDGATVTGDEIIRGYELGEGSYVLVTDEELESLSPERSRTIEIVEFIDLKDVDPVFYDHPYYLVPSKGGEKAYRLLVEVMRRTNKAGLAKLVLAEREHLVAVTSRDGALAVLTLHYADEVVPEEGLEPKERAEAGEEARMKESIGQMVRAFDPAKYADGRRKKVLDLLAAKLKEQALVEAPAVPDVEGEGPPDLVAALEESIRLVKEGR
jgi:DNA end-binding protein Ku